MATTRLGTLDTSFLTIESPTAHMHVGWAALFAPPPGRSAPSFEELREHIGARLGRTPRYRQKLAQVPLGVNDPVWVDDDAFDLDHHVLHTPSPRFAEVVDMVMSTQLDRDRPLWEVWIADRLPDGRIGIVGKAHHCMVDGIAAVELATLLLDPTPTAPREAGDGWRPRRPPAGGELLVEGAGARLRDLASLARVPLQLARLATRPRRLPDAARRGVSAARALVRALQPAPLRTPLNRRISAGRHLAIGRRPLGDLKRIGRRFDATVNDVVLAAAAGGVREFLADRGDIPLRLKTMVPVSVRRDDEKLGNRISFVFIDLPCDEPDPIQRLAEIKRAMGERKRGGEPNGADTVLQAAHYAPRAIQQTLARMMASPRTFNLVVSNIPGPPEPLYMLGCRLEETYPVVPLADHHAVSIGMTTLESQAFFGLFADRRSLPDADRLAAALDESLDELCELSR